MKLWSLPRKAVAVVGAMAILGLVLYVYAASAPVVVLHYSATATKPIGYFFNDDDDITKALIYPGTQAQFRTARSPREGYVIEVSMPAENGDGVEIKPPFSRVDVYIGADAKIERTVTRTDFMAKFFP